MTTCRICARKRCSCVNSWNQSFYFASLVACACCVQAGAAHALLLPGHPSPGQCYSKISWELPRPKRQQNSQARYPFTRRTLVPCCTRHEVVRIRGCLCRVCPGCSLIASYGPNRLVVRYPKLLARYYPDHVTNATIYGRLINNDFIVNVNPSYYHDSKVTVARRSHALVCR